MTSRIVVLVDMDCFYCQVEERLNPALKGKPVAVVQYNQWMGGGIIAVNYEARKFGVTRGLRGIEAKKKCPEINLVSVPAERGKADLTKYRDAGREVVDVLCQFSSCVERASIDEAYLDITECVEKKMLTVEKVNAEQLRTTFIVGCGDSGCDDEEKREIGVKSWLNSIYSEAIVDSVEMKMAIAGLLVEEIRAAVYKTTGFHCSAGIAHNKILSKLACGLHKPNRQSILTQTGVAELYKTLPIKKVRSMGGKFGDMVVEQLDCKVMADLLKFSEKQLQQKFDEKTGSWLYNIARGVDNEPVTPRLISKSIGCCKKFPGKTALATRAEVQKWMLELASEVSERANKDLVDNKRRATLLTASYSQCGESRSRSGPLASYEPQRISTDAVELIKKSNNAAPGDNDTWVPPLQFLGISIGKFVDEDSAKKSTIHNFFKPISEASASTDDSKISSVSDPSTSKIELHNNKTSCDIESVDEDSAKKSTIHNFFKLTSEASASTDASKNSSVSDPSTSKIDLHDNKTTCDIESIPGSSKHCQEDVVQVEETLDGDTFISLDEIFPDLKNVDENIIPHLPKKLQEELKKRLSQMKSETKQCPVCHEHLLPSMLSKHMIMHSAPNESDDSRRCHICDQQFSASKIAEHIKSHSIKEPKENPIELKRIHRKRPNLGNKLIGCPVCAKQFPGNQIDKHMLSHSCQEEPMGDRLETADKKSSKCPVCDECFEDLTAHMKSHQSSLTEEVRAPKSNTGATVEVIKCSKCEECVGISEYQEHLDFHTAQELDKELNQVVRPSPTISTVPPTKKRRGRPGKKPITASDKKLQCITAFFIPKS